MNTPESLFSTRWLGIYRIGTWDYVRRPQTNSCVGILAETDDQEIVLIEQFRIPVQSRVIEIPAGLVGDEEEEHLASPPCSLPDIENGEDFSEDYLRETARRELLEETGYDAASVVKLIRTPTSAGMTSEFTHLFHATGLTKRHDGGGIGGEKITVHLVPRANLRTWLKQKENEGLVLDFKIHAALWLAGL